MYYTSYYGNRQLNPDRHFLVRISNSAPAGFHVDHVINEAIPDWDTLIKPYKEGSLNEIDYTLKYKKQLSNKMFNILLELDDIKANAKDKDVVFLCYEKPSDFCHRHVFAQWLADQHEIYSLDVEELKNDNAQQTLF